MQRWTPFPLSLIFHIMLMLFFVFPFEIPQWDVLASRVRPILYLLVVTLSISTMSQHQDLNTFLWVLTLIHRCIFMGYYSLVGSIHSVPPQHYTFVPCMFLVRCYHWVDATCLVTSRHFVSTPSMGPLGCIQQGTIITMRSSRSYTPDT